MKYWSLFLILFGIGVVYADCSLTVEERSGVPVRILKNRWIQAEIAPQASGSVVGLRYLPLKQELMAPFIYKVEKIDLLPDQIQVSSGGGRTALWGHKLLLDQKMKVNKEESVSERAKLEMFHQYYQGLPCSFRRWMILERDAAMLKIGFTLKNNGDTPLTLRPWDNLVMQLNSQGRDDVIIPTLGGISQIGGMGVQQISHDQIFIKKRDMLTKEIKMVAARNWLARRNNDSPLIFAVRLISEPLSPDGFFYSWSGDGASPICTMEVVCPPAKLEPGQERAYEFEYLIFQGMTDLKEICGDIGINCEIQKNRIEWQFAVVRPVPAQTLLVYAGKQELGEFNLPAMRPGQAYQVSLPLGDLPKSKLPISGKFATGASFELLEPQLVIEN